MQPKFPVISYPPSSKHCATIRIVSGSGIIRLEAAEAAAGTSTLAVEGALETFSVGFSVGAGGGPFGSGGEPFGSGGEPFGSGGGMHPLAFVPSGAVPEVVLCLQKLRCLKFMFFSVTTVKSKVNY